MPGLRGSGEFGGPGTGMLLVGGVGAAIYVSAGRRSEKDKAEATASAIVDLKCMVGSEKITLFQDSKFIEALAKDVHGDAFKTRLDSAFRLGREEISGSASLMSGKFLERNFVGIEPNGGTALFEATRKAYLESAARRRADPESYYSIVVMTDGESNQGISARGFEAWYSHCVLKGQNECNCIEGFHCLLSEHFVSRWDLLLDQVQF